MFEEIKYNKYLDKAIEQLAKGAFMTTKVNNKVNTMTISWGSIGIVWNKPTFIAYVRFTRDTYQMIEQADEFTISIPFTDDLKDELIFCGTKSGRDYDKIKECNFSLTEGITSNTPIINECDLHYECKVIYKQTMEPGMVPQVVKDRYYSKNNYHMIYYGEITNTYIKKENNDE
ncbi:MAG: flavin reductase family protein [Candidatus Izemoplasma sp.]